MHRRHPAESEENPSMKKGNLDAFFEEKGLTENIHLEGRYADCRDGGIGRAHHDGFRRNHSWTKPDRNANHRAVP